MSGGQLEFDFGEVRRLPPRYHYVAAGGTFEHRSGDCQLHGENVVHFKIYKAEGPYYCVACALELQKALL